MTETNDELPEDREVDETLGEASDTVGDPPTDAGPDAGDQPPEVAADTGEQPAGVAEDSYGGPPGGGGPPGDEPGDGAFASIPGWAWVIIGLMTVALVMLVTLLVSGDDADDTAASDTTVPTDTSVPETTTTPTTAPETTTTTEAEATTTTVAETTTTTVAETTTTTVAETTTTTVAETTTTTTVAETTTTTTVAETTTTTVPAGSVEVESSPLSALLGVDIPPYGSVEVVEPGTVEVQWYQWDDLFVVLFRGVSIEANLCLGESLLLVNTVDYFSISELGDDEPCAGLNDDRFAGEDFGVRTCGELVYYLTEIPTSESGRLYGSVELWAGAWDVSGAVGGVATEVGEAPEFDPAAPGYVLPASDVDDLIEVACG